MPRQILTPEEREIRRRERNRRGFTEAKFRQYDPGDGLGYGSEAQWRAAAGGGFTFDNVEGPAPKIDTDLQTLGLTAMPKDGAVLKSAFRKASFVAHPDYGGSDAAFIALKQAYARVFAKLGV